jgi:hypothetical protein
MSERRTMRYCPCCGQELSAMTDVEFQLWLEQVAEKLRREGKTELAAALEGWVRAAWR